MVPAATLRQSALLATAESRVLWRLAGVSVLHPRLPPPLAFGTFDSTRYPGDAWEISYSGHDPKLSEGCQDKHLFLILHLSDQEFHSQP